MTTAIGLVQQLKWNPSIYALFAWIGPTPANTQLLYVLFRQTDTSAELSIKSNLGYGLMLAQLYEAQVTAVHGNMDSEITSVTIGPLASVTVVDQPIQLDFFSVTGDGIPTDAVMVFKSGGGMTTVTPDLIRPQLALVAKLPTTVPVGPGTLQVLSPGGWTTLPVVVNVLAGPPLVKRVIQPGLPKTSPFTFVIAADPALYSFASGTYSTDPVLTNRSNYHDIVLYCLRNFLTLTEDVFRASDRDVSFRFVSIFDNSLVANATNSLAATYNPNIIGPRQSTMASFAASYGEKADLFFTITGDPIYTRASANLTVDDNTRGGAVFTYDGAAHTHRYFASLPGCAAIPLAVNTMSPTALHELGHAVSDVTNGGIYDLYIDGGPGGFQENKKYRAAATDPVPASFANYNGTLYASDPTRDALGYPAGWVSYHPQLIDATRPNLMDNFWYSTPYTAVRIDRLTYQFVTDRLAAKFMR